MLRVCATIAAGCVATAVLVAAGVEPAQVAATSAPRPVEFPVPSTPGDNPYSLAKADLGRHLFYDSRLSGNGAYACSSCHQQHRAFTDGRARAIGATGDEHRRNAMSLTNVAYNRAFNWADGETASLEAQMRVPMFGLDPIEMGISGREREVLARLAEDEHYREQFSQVFPADADPIRFGNIIKAIATFERTLISADSHYDRFVRGDRSALSPSQLRGWKLFFSDRLHCSGCHGGFNFAGNTGWFERPFRPLQFHNTGLYNLGRGRYPEIDRGRVEQTGRRRDMGRFRAPTLRNIELTAPYMHDGSVSTLEEAIDHYNAGGRAGRANRRKSDRIRPLYLTPAERADLVAFLHSLTDRGFVSDPRLGSPWVTGWGGAEQLTGRSARSR